MGGGTGGTVGGGGTGGGGMTGGMGGAGGGTTLEFTDYVKDLIVNKTSSTTLPDDFTTKTFKDSMNPAAFTSLFP
jgi:hypothetical protein